MAEAVARVQAARQNQLQARHRKRAFDLGRRAREVYGMKGDSNEVHLSGMQNHRQYP